MQALHEACAHPGEVIVRFTDEASFYRQPSQAWLWASLGRRRAYLASPSMYGRKGSFVARWGLIDNVGRDRLLSEAEF